MEETKKVLHCHSKGDTRFSPFFCRVKILGIEDTIENHYQTTKTFVSAKTGERVRAKNWRQAKAMQSTLDWSQREFSTHTGIPLGTENSAKEDLVIQFYIACWYKYLRGNPELLDYARGFDTFVDIFAGKFPFSQAKVIEKAAKEGIESLCPMFKDFLSLCAPVSH